MLASDPFMFEIGFKSGKSSRPVGIGAGAFPFFLESESILGTESELSLTDFSAWSWVFS